MLRSSGAVVVLGASIACMLFGPARTQAQLIGRHIGGTGFSTIDEAALGDTVLASVGFFLGANEYTGGGGMGVAGGAFRGYAGGADNSRGQWSVGAGYARSLATRELAGNMYATVGGELLGGVRHTRFAPHEVGAIDLTAPLGLIFGNPSGPSLGFYAAPYAEAGVGRQWVNNAPCGQVPACSTLSDVGLTHALGMDAGFRLSFGRFSAGFMLSDVLVRGRRPFEVGDGVIGLTHRIGQ